jgi:hypothetical protein
MQDQFVPWAKWAADQDPHYISIHTVYLQNNFQESQEYVYQCFSLFYSKFLAITPGGQVHDVLLDVGSMTSK